MGASSSATLADGDFRCPGDRRSLDPRTPVGVAALAGVDNSVRGVSLLSSSTSNLVLTSNFDLDDRRFDFLSPFASGRLNILGGISGETRSRRTRTEGGPRSVVSPSRSSTGYVFIWDLLLAL